MPEKPSKHFRDRMGDPHSGFADATVEVTPNPDIPPAARRVLKKMREEEEEARRLQERDDRRKSK